MAGSQDGKGCNDRNKPYTPEQMSAAYHPGFTGFQFAHLMFLRSRVQDDPYNGDTHVTGPTWPQGGSQ